MSALVDQKHMRRALTLAKHQHGRTGKNPAVGCVICDADGAVLSEGATGDGGTDHAEELALAGLAPDETAGGTAYVTLEPCRERSAGGLSCSERLVSAGVARVVCAIKDPHPNGAGGANRLREAGITVDIGRLESDASPLYADFFAGIET